MKRHRARQPAQRKGFLTEGFTRSEVARAADSRQPGQPSAVPALLRANPAGRFLSATGNRGWLLGLLLVLATVLAYQPAWQGGFLWDDDFYLTQNRMLFEPGGLKQM